MHDAPLRGAAAARLRPLKAIEQPQSQAPAELCAARDADGRRFATLRDAVSRVSAQRKYGPRAAHTQMGDFGPAYASRNAPRTLYRCEDCGAALPFSGGEGSCSLCGGNLRAIGPDAGAGPAPAGREAVAQLAAEVLQQIVPQELLEELALPSADRGTEESVLEELPVEKVEPFALLSVWRAADDDAAALRGALVVMRRGGCSFVDKVRRITTIAKAPLELTAVEAEDADKNTAYLKSTGRWPLMLRQASAQGIRGRGPLGLI